MVSKLGGGGSWGRWIFPTCLISTIKLGLAILEMHVCNLSLLKDGLVLSVGLALQVRPEKPQGKVTQAWGNHW